MRLLFVFCFYLTINLCSTENHYQALLQESYSLSPNKYVTNGEVLSQFFDEVESSSSDSFVIKYLYNKLLIENSQQPQQCKTDAAYVTQSYNDYTSLKNDSRCKVTSRNYCECKNETQYELAQLNWIGKLLDSFGTKGSYIREGNYFFLGGYHECLETTSYSENTDAKFNGKYCTLSAIEYPKTELSEICEAKKTETNESFIPFRFGFCIPNSCYKNQIKMFSESVIFTSKFKVRFNVTCHEKLDLSGDTPAIALICVYSVLGVVLFVATIYDLVLREIKVDEKKPNYNLITKIVLCFSIVTNAQKILSTNSADGQLNCVHGIRFISMSWVILGHTYFLAIIAVDNIVRVFQIRNEFTEQIIMNGTFSVDTFFVLSGTLLCFLWLNETEKQNGKNITSPTHWILYYVMRFIRLTPTYMLIMGFDIAIFRYLLDGPLWEQMGFEKDFCKDTWWKNLIYLNNFIDPRHTCMAWTWYLANDMQFHWICPIVLILLWKAPKAGIFLASLFVITGCLSTGVISYVNNYPPNQINFNKNSSQFSSDAFGYFDGIYVKPYTRAGPFFLGVILGYILFKAKNKNLKLTTPVNIACWLVAACLNLSVAYGLYGVTTGNIMNKFVSALYSAVARSVWGLGVCWVIFACITGNGGVVNRFLSWKVFMPLSRMTYCAYLIHPLVLLVAYTGRQTAIHFDSDYTMVYYYIPNLVIAYGLAFVASLALEAPVVGLQKLLFVKKKNDTNKSTTASEQSLKGEAYQKEFPLWELKIDNVTKESQNSDENVADKNSAINGQVNVVDTEKNWEASIRKLGKPARSQLEIN